MNQIPILDPRHDIVFKTIFSKESEAASIARNSLISAFLGRDVKESIVINNDSTIENIHDKASRLDLQCILEDKTKVDIEIQIFNASDCMEEVLSL